VTALLFWPRFIVACIVTALVVAELDRVQLVRLREDGAAPRYDHERRHGHLDIRLALSLALVLCAGLLGDALADAGLLAAFAAGMGVAFVQLIFLARAVADAGTVPATHQAVRPGKGPRPAREGSFGGHRG
jgi:hypothetical protein